MISVLDFNIQSPTTTKAELHLVYIPLRRLQPQMRKLCSVGGASRIGRLALEQFQSLTTSISPNSMKSNTGDNQSLEYPAPNCYSLLWTGPRQNVKWEGIALMG